MVQKTSTFICTGYKQGIFWLTNPYKEESRSNKTSKPSLPETLMWINHNFCKKQPSKKLNSSNSSNWKKQLINHKTISSFQPEVRGLTTKYSYSITSQVNFNFLQHLWKHSQQSYNISSAEKYKQKAVLAEHHSNETSNISNDRQKVLPSTKWEM